MSTGRVWGPRTAIKLSCAVMTLAGAGSGLWVVQPPLAKPGVLVLVLGLIVLAWASGVCGVRLTDRARAGERVTGTGQSKWARSDSASGGVFEGEGPGPGATSPMTDPLGPPPGATAPGGGPAVHQVLAAGEWWNQTPIARSASSRSAPDPARPGAGLESVTDPSTYLADAVIAQCPECGSMQLDVEAAQVGYLFGCPSCLTSWRWRPDTPWPAVRLRPGTRAAQSPARAAHPKGH